MTKQEMPRLIGVRHVGLSALDPVALAEFYRDVLGLRLVPTDTAALGTTAFLSSHPVAAVVDLVFFANSSYQHTAFEVASLADLRALYRPGTRPGGPVQMALNHGVSPPFYFGDPQGDMVEGDLPTGVRTV